MFPLVVIDFEASALSLESYPIEVGIARQDDIAARVEIWSSLIRPDSACDLDRQWDPDAERIHGITRWQLREAADPAYVMRELNRRAGNAGTVWCDGGHYDEHWLRTLATTAGVEPEFELGDIGQLLIQYPRAGSVFRRVLQGSTPPHRAGPDAERLCSALVEALNATAATEGGNLR